MGDNTTTHWNWVTGSGGDRSVVGQEQHVYLQAMREEWDSAVDSVHTTYYVHNLGIKTQIPYNQKQ